MLVIADPITGDLMRIRGKLVRLRDTSAVLEWFANRPWFIGPIYEIREIRPDDEVVPGKPHIPPAAV